MVRKLSDQEHERRARRVRNVIACAALEGRQITAELTAELERYANGEITSWELVARNVVQPKTDTHDHPADERLRSDVASEATRND
ncbi:antitoxin VbhA family protein [Leifsonia xyli]|uniref:antitoxin VbhA family protein n=1 Tax=Leifsonia xyli TaxID=1575 RepID=UPI003D66F4CD